MLPTRRKDRTDRTRRYAKPTAPAAPHALSALVMRVPVGSPACPSFARINLPSLFAVFLAGCANASLVGILSDGRLSFPANRSLGGSPNAGARPPSQVVLPIQSWTLGQAYPRAPPI